MYRKPDYSQLNIYDFVLPFGGHLDKNNRWVILRDAIDWKIIDEIYQGNFKNHETGNEALPSDLAFGSLYIQRKLSLTDRELVEQISENPYMQYFIGFKEFTTEKPFDPSLMVAFRKRFPEEVMNKISEKMFLVEEEPSDDDDDGTPPGGGAGVPSDDGNADGSGPGNKGTLMIDASCAPADIAYPTDLELCDKARRWTEIILDHYWKECGAAEGNGNKPRTYRKTARRRFLALNKRKRKSAKKIRAELRYQLNCIRRNLGYIDRYVEVYGTGILHRIEAERLLTIQKFEEQQRYMLNNRVHSVDDRIVSLSQPWVRPIVRGKSKAPTEFGAKISISVVEGYTFLDRISFDAYNEGDHDEFEAVVEKYHERFGYYPERILADKIYRSRKNRGLCKRHGIRLAGPKLGKPGKNHMEEMRQELKEIGERNAVEGKFGNGKRKLGLGLIMAKLKETTGNMISMDIFILNMEQYMRTCIVLCCAILENLEFAVLKNKEKKPGLIVVNQ
ncbi:IS5 family transposase [Hominisplanchenecus murintestinalis]|uniref:IS5 family transposase n=1 Tax=Hominisplanchenecus murintestinalis TaxID=2941517 RepID=A0AC61QZA2_9FIRM|nr:IS5 family transposase [Hominisplanchenecus murintestinalis]TGX98805.1 IS5 family transposase [Hominisplanchenecus murintestinalis]